MTKNTFKTLILLAFVYMISTESVSAQEAATLGQMVDSTYNAFKPIQTFLASISYILGAFFVFSALKMMREYTESPGDVKPLHVGLRFLGGALFILTPFTANLLTQTTGAGPVGNVLNLVEITGDLSNSTTTNTDLAGILQNLMVDLWAPLMNNLIPFFCYVAGLVLMLVGLKRLALAANDGPQAPGGLGTMTTFFVAAGLMSIGFLMNVSQGTVFGINKIYGNIVLLNSSGNSTTDQQIQDTLWAVFMFLRLVGYISFIRGLFVLRGAAEGEQNASMMAAVTHITAGTILANAGAFANAIQSTILGTDTSNWYIQAS